MHQTILRGQFWSRSAGAASRSEWSFGVDSWRGATADLDYKGKGDLLHNLHSVQLVQAY